MEDASRTADHHLQFTIDAMPFKSEKQRKWMWANKPEMAKKWANEKDDIEEDDMKITKKEIKEIIEAVCNEPFSRMKSRAHPSIRRAVRKQRRSPIISEVWGSGKEQMSVLIQFSEAYASLGGMVQEQLNDVINSYIDGGEDFFRETVYEVNPNAIDIAYKRLAPILKMYDGDLGDEGELVLDAMNAAKEIFAQGEAEVEADARAAGDL